MKQLKDITLSSPRKTQPLSFVARVSDDSVLHANLLASPRLAKSNALHEAILVRDAADAASGLNAGLEQAKNGWIVWIDQRHPPSASGSVRFLTR
jgi:hypothetical protein